MNWKQTWKGFAINGSYQPVLTWSIKMKYLPNVYPLINEVANRPTDFHNIFLFTLWNEYLSIDYNQTWYTLTTNKDLAS